MFSEKSALFSPSWYEASQMACITYLIGTVVGFGVHHLMITCLFDTMIVGMCHLVITSLFDAIVVC